MQQTDNYHMNKSELNDFADIRKVVDNFDTIDKGIIYDVGISSGTGNDYILDLGSIALTIGKKPSFRFWADKDSTGAVTINSNYNLIKAGGIAVTNLKKDAPYIITFDGNANFFLASGGGTDTVSFTSDKLLEGYTANDSDGNAVSGTMPERGNVTQVLTLNGTINLPEGHYKSIKVTQNVISRDAYTDAVSSTADSNYLYTRIPVGAYFTKASTGYPEIKSSISSVTAALNTLSATNKTSILESLGGTNFLTGTKTGIDNDGSYAFYEVTSNKGLVTNVSYLEIECSFVPKYIIIIPTPAYGYSHVRSMRLYRNDGEYFYSSKKCDYIVSGGIYTNGSSQTSNSGKAYSMAQSTGFKDGNIYRIPAPTTSCLYVVIG